MDEENLTLKKTKIASAPFIDKVMKEVDLQSVLGKHITHRRYVTAIEVLIKSHLMEPAALYRIPYLAKQFGWGNEKINDDLLARALDAIFKADKSTLQTELILKVISTYELDTSIIHNDSTSIKFFGEYEHQAKRSVKLKRGHSKDHRPDLKQIIYNLCVCADEAVPIHFKCYDGTKTDDTLHIETWLTLRGMLGEIRFHLCWRL